MALQAGARVGGFQIAALLGAGGMGEVYRALDTRLGREVAIKILAPRIAADADGVMRFEREARLLAALNHPNIAAIYGVEEAGPGQPALVLELVDGETLSDRIARGPIPVAGALECARQIADALDAAHEAGIVHRDLKPGNIKITSGGAIKVLDFGLAKAIAAAAHDPAVDPAHSPTITIAGTHGGVILGTAAYMSPEQARGKPLDKRTDIWAFGCVLFEMLTGRRAFAGETTSDVIARILEREPDWSALPATVPAHVRRVLGRCLEKDPKRRARDIADVHVELDDAPATPATSRRPPGLGVAAVLVLIVAALLAMQLLRRSANAPASSFALSLLAEVNTSFRGNSGLALSPDGRTIAYAARDADGATAVWLRPIDQTSAVRLKGTDGVSGAPFWSPDSRHIGFFAGGYLRRVQRDGGPVTSITRAAAFAGASWNRDDVIVLSPASRTTLHRVPASGGTPEPITKLDDSRENSHRWPHFLPDGDHFLFTARSDVRENNLIYVGSLQSGTIKPLRSAQSDAEYAPGYLLFAERGTLMAQRFDVSTQTLSGEPMVVAADVRHNTPSSEASYSVSADGRVLVYLPDDNAPAHLLWFDRSGKQIGSAGPPRRYAEATLSPDARSVVVDIPDPDSGTRELWMMDLASAALTRFTSNRATDWMAAWSPDGTQIAFASDRAGLSSVFVKRADGSGDERLVYRGARGAFPTDWSPDGRTLLVHLDSSGPGAIMAVPLDGGEATTVLEGRPFMLQGARLSPDGRWLAYESLETDEREIYVSPFGRPGRTRVSTAGGSDVAWRGDGRELFYVSPAGDVMAAAVDRGERLTVAPPTKLFSSCRATTPPTIYVPPMSFSVTSDGSRFLARCGSQQDQTGVIGVLINWTARLR